MFAPDTRLLGAAIERAFDEPFDEVADRLLFSRRACRTPVSSADRIRSLPAAPTPTSRLPVCRCASTDGLGVGVGVMAAEGEIAAAGKEGADLAGGAAAVPNSCQPIAHFGTEHEPVGERLCAPHATPVLPPTDRCQDMSMIWSVGSRGA
ncbi:hypothetical protein [Virgisporangium ochraceum]|uniref:hypothetical protein n=1 Tax=Virgisporangium ochraceum TaxID=65505 RepID=UPI0035A25D58